MPLYRRVLSACKGQIAPEPSAACATDFPDYKNRATLNRLAIVAGISGLAQIIWMLVYGYGPARPALPPLLGGGFAYVACMAALTIWVRGLEKSARRFVPWSLGLFLLLFTTMETAILYMETGWIGSIARIFITLMGLAYACAFYPSLQLAAFGVYLLAATATVLRAPQISPAVLPYVYGYAVFMWLLTRSHYSASIRGFASDYRMAEAASGLKRSHEEIGRLSKNLADAYSHRNRGVMINRRVYDEYLTRLWRECAHCDNPLTVVMVRVDGYSAYVARFGQSAGEDCLHRVGQSLCRAARRDMDMVAAGADGMFYVLLPYLTGNAGMKIARQMRAYVEELQIPHQQGVVTVSVGVVTRHPSSALSPLELLDACEKALRQAEQQGQNCVVENRDGHFRNESDSAAPSLLDSLGESSGMQAIVDKMAKCYFVWDIPSNRLEFSPRVKHFTGADKTRFEDMDEVLSLIYPVDQQSLLQSVQDSLESTGTNAPAVFRVRNANGSFKWAKLQVNCVRDENGEPCQMVGIVDDADQEMHRYQVFDLITEGAVTGLFSLVFKTRALWVNDTLRLLLGITGEPDIAKLRLQIHPEDWVTLLKQIRSLKPGQEERIVRMIRVEDAQSRSLWLTVRAKASWDADGSLYLLAGAVTDITEQMVSRSTNSLIVEGSTDCVYTLDMVSGRMEFSPKIMEMTALTQTVLENGVDAWIQMIVPEDRERFLSALEGIYDGSADEYAAEFRLIGKGEPVWVASRGKVSRDGSGAPVLLAGSILSIEGMWQYNRFMEEQSLTDRVTGLPNRVSFYRDAGARMRSGGQGYVVLMDLDDFKNLNSMHGHSVGDKVLRRFGAIIQDYLPPQGRLYHLGGDLFAVDLQDYSLEQAKRWMVSVFARHNNGIIVENAECYLTFSAGAVAYQVGTTVDELLADADIAVNKIKKHGKAGYTVFDPEDRVGYLQKLEMEGIMRRCVENGMKGFELFYQPLMKAGTQECVGAEALLRWRRGSHDDVLSPDVILPCLEKIGLLAYVENWVVREGLAACRRWIERGAAEDFVMNINLTPMQITRRNLPGDVVRMIQENRLHPSNLTLEITEASCVLEMQSGIGTLSALRAGGIGIAIDDFGTGYSSLSYLRELEVDEVKIDRSFIRDIVESQGGRAFVQSVIQLSHSIGHMVCVEGVETGEQASLLDILQADVLQGYHFCHPVPEEEFFRQFIKEEYLR